MLTQILNPSNYAFSWFALPMLFVGVMIAGLGFGVLVTERGSRISLAFATLTWSVALWLLGFVLIYSTPIEPIARWWARIEQIGVVLIPSTVYVFTLAIVRQLWPMRVLAWVSFALSALFYLTILFTDQFITGLRHYAWGFYPQYGLISLLFLAFFFITMVVSLHRFWVGYHSAPTHSQRQRLRAFFIAFSIAYLGSVDYLAAYGIPVYPFGYAPVFIFLVLSAYALRRYRLIDITPAFAARHILDIMTDALVVLDHEGIVRVVNQEACKLFGKAELELVGAPTATIHSHFVMALPNGAPHDRWDYEVSLTTNCVLSVSACVMRAEDNQPTAVIYLARDITERKHAEEKIQQRSLELQNLSHRLIEVQENERKLLAADRHDSVVQWLNGLFCDKKTDIAERWRHVMRRHHSTSNFVGVNPACVTNASKAPS